MIHSILFMNISSFVFSDFFTLESFDMLEPCAVLNLLCHRQIVFQVTGFCNFSNALKAGYHEQSKTHRTRSMVKKTKTRELLLMKYIKISKLPIRLHHKTM